jgi:hypothetical protein
MRDFMSDKHDLLVEETRQAFFQLENLVTSIDNKAFGMIALDTILLSIFAYVFTLFPTCSGILLYVSPMLIMLSLLLVLICIKPRKWYSPDNEKTIKLFENKPANEIARILAANYTSYDIVLTKIYNKKIEYLKYGVWITIISIVVELFVLAYLIFLQNRPDLILV